MTTRFKPISGGEDQAAGLIFRDQDRDNYYILRANALGNNVNFCIYRRGRRSSLRGANTPVASRSWQELRLEVQGNQFRGFLNGQQATDSSDDSYKPGGIGLWTKADSVTASTTSSSPLADIARFVSSSQRQLERTVASIHVVRLAQREGLVTFGPDAADRRATRVWLTPLAIAFGPVAAEVVETLHGRVVSTLGARDTHSLERMLTMLMKL